MKYSPRLDSLRALAVLMVLLDHFGWMYFSNYGLGAAGVNLFFVLSGFLITRIIINSKTQTGQQIKNFYGRRILRIFPIYYLTLIFLFLVNDPAVQRYNISLLTYTFNYSAIFWHGGTGNISHFWSLAVEEQFYIFWGLIAIPFRKNEKLLKTILITVICISFLQIAFNVFIPGKYNYLGTFPRTYVLGIGCITAIITNQRSFTFPKALDWLALTCAVFFLIHHDKWSDLVLPLSWIYFIYKCSTTQLFTKPIQKLLEWKYLQKLGVISYGVYVFHRPLYSYIGEPFCFYLYKVLDWKSFGKPLSYFWYNQYVLPIIVSTLLTIAIAALSFTFIEKPILQFKNKYFKSSCRKTDNRNFSPAKPVISGLSGTER